MIRFDKGGENCLIAESQIAFGLFHGDGLAGARGVRYGSSPSNSVRMVNYRTNTQYSY